MGTDDHPGPDVAGAVAAARDFGITILLVGDQPRIETEMNKHDTNGLMIEVCHAEQVISMTDKPVEAGKEKKQSSMHVGMNLVKAGEADAFVTAGNTGGALTVATLHSLGRIKGVKRPAITALGNVARNLVIVTDVGANTDTKIDWLEQFAIMANLYAQQVLNIERPRVGLLSNGEEPGKGNQLVREAGPIFEKLPLHFIGNIEPKHIMKGKVDVIIADGYVGNILLKTFEATVEAMFLLIRDELSADLRSKLGGALSRPALKRVYKNIDPTQYGGAPLLGIDGVVIITHGGSSAQMIRNSIYQAKRAVETNVIETIRTGLEEYQNKENQA